MISVCMATYNGEKYIKEQLSSILSQLGSNDEIIISDDKSTDNTINIIKSFNDVRIKVISGLCKKSPTINFENALKNCKGDYIFLSDQDDIWYDNRVKVALSELKDEKCLCVLNNYSIINQDGEIIKKCGFDNNDHVLKKSFLLQLFSPQKYIGCCMAFKRDLLEIALPFPPYIPMHDMWIGLLASYRNNTHYISEPLVYYRRHGKNVTTGISPYSVFNRISIRISLLFKILRRIYF